MSGLDDILNLIEAQQKQTEDSIMKSAADKARKIKADGAEKANKAYEEHLSKAKVQAEKDFENSCASADAAMKRKILACKVELIDEAIEKTIDKLKKLPDKEYFELILKLVERHIQPDKGFIELGKADLARTPKEFESELNTLASKKGGSIQLSKEAADIDDGFILSYGLISENCSFKAMIESEKDEIRDTAARALFR
ncbi:V-type ATP synthase subunit E [Ruminococcus flavefaciens]|uniref:V/A-type H+-transporting ATPase subunit E n=1 Tax=Ruminococcus flavefaciens TaxID=1265 RepID=A0A1M7H9T7_RUMFL|nr:V-type ATP synthase subunit E family protein [Ruminococcus flavefaciens]SHM25168.1 V/A-type H+-transporting ATPase subunit E [Ruminococcus flavefaciens]